LLAVDGMSCSLTQAAHWDSSVNFGCGKTMTALAIIGSYHQRDASAAGRFSSTGSIFCASVTPRCARDAVQISL
jgi:hypothetical protein